MSDKDVLDLLATGLSEEAILKDYPDLESEDIKAYLGFRDICRRCSAAACFGASIT